MNEQQIEQTLEGLRRFSETAASLGCTVSGSVFIPKKPAQEAAEQVVAPPESGMQPDQEEISFAPINAVLTESIWIPGGRLRHDVGDISALAGSMERDGLINPVLVDENLHLVAGERRVAAAKLLGWQLMPVRFVDPADRRSIEIAENAQAKPYTPEEIGRYAVAVWDHPRKAGETGTTRDIIGRQLGVSGVHAERCRKLVERMDADPEEGRKIRAVLEERGAKAAEALVKEWDEEALARRLPIPSTSRLFWCNPEELQDAITARSADLVMTKFDGPVGPALLDPVLDYAKHALRPNAALALVVAAKDVYDVASVCVAHGSFGFRTIFTVVVEGASPIYVLVLGRHFEKTPYDALECIDRDATAKAPLSRIVGLLSKEGDLVTDPRMGDCSVFHSCAGRDFLGADLLAENLAACEQAIAAASESGEVAE